MKKVEKKTLLAEATARRFMKLANMGNAGKPFLKEMYGKEEEEEEGKDLHEEYEEEEEHKLPEEEEEEGSEMPEDDDVDMDMGDEGGEEPLEVEPAGKSDKSAEDVVKAILSALESMGAVEVVGGDEEGEELGGEEDLDMPTEEDPALGGEMPPEEEENKMPLAERKARQAARKAKALREAKLNKMH